MVETSAHDHAEQAQVLSRIRGSIQAQFGRHLKRIVLFGSRARGDAKPDSDYDLLVVVDEVNRNMKDAIDEIAGQMLYQFGVVMAAFLTSESTARGRKFDPLFMNIEKEGVPV